MKFFIVEETFITPYQKTIDTMVNDVFFIEQNAWEFIENVIHDDYYSDTNCEILKVFIHPKTKNVAIVTWYAEDAYYIMLNYKIKVINRIEDDEQIEKDAFEKAKQAPLKYWAKDQYDDWSHGPVMV